MSYLIKTAERISKMSFVSERIPCLAGFATVRLWHHGLWHGRLHLRHLQLLSCGIRRRLGLPQGIRVAFQMKRLIMIKTGVRLVKVEVISVFGEI